MKNTILKGVRTIKTGLTSYSGTVSEFRFWLQKQDLAKTLARRLGRGILFTEKHYTKNF